MFGLGRSRGSLAAGIRFDDDVRVALQRSRGIAARHAQARVTVDHLLLAVLEAGSSDANHLVISLGARPDHLATTVTELLEESGARRSRVEPTKAGPELPYSSEAKRVLEVALREAADLDHDSIGTAHLLLGILADRNALGGKLLRQAGVTADAARKRLAAGPPLTAPLEIAIDEKSDRLIYQQIVAQVREAIATGRILPGDRLPPIRQLADRLEVAPGTVARAYGDLEEARVVVTDRARGTFVAPNRGPETAEPSIPLRDLLRPAVVAAYHQGATAADLRIALAAAMAGIYPDIEMGK